MEYAKDHSFTQQQQREIQPVIDLSKLEDKIKNLTKKDFEALGTLTNRFLEIRKKKALERDKQDYLVVKEFLESA